MINHKHGKWGLKGITSFRRQELAILIPLLLFSFLIRVLLFPEQGYPIDTGCFTSWFGTATNSLRTFYDSAGYIDYPPFGVYLFWAFGSLAKAFSISTETMIKVVPNLFDVAIAVLIFAYVRKESNFKLATIATALYAFNPAVIYNAAVWGQWDAVYTFFLVLSLILAVKTKPKLSAVAFALAILTKPQSIALAPLIAFLIYKNGGKNAAGEISDYVKTSMASSWSKLNVLLISIFVFAVTIFVVILPFQWSDPVNFLSKIYFTGLNQYPYLSVNAFNFWGLFGMWVPDGNMVYVGWAMFGVFAAFVLYFLHKRYDGSNEMLAFFAAFLLLFAFFMLPTRIHERYMFPVISMLALMFPLYKKSRPLYVVLTGTLFVNQAYVLYWLIKALPYAPNLTGDPVVIITCIVNLIMFAYAIIIMWDELKGGAILKPIKTMFEIDEQNPQATTAQTQQSMSTQNLQNEEEQNLQQKERPISETVEAKTAEPQKQNLQAGRHLIFKLQETKLNLDFKIRKIDIASIILLMILFFSIASTNLGLAQAPNTTATLSDGQSFYVDLGSQANVYSVVFLLKGGALNVTISSGSPGNWQTVVSNSRYPSGTGEDYYKWSDDKVINRNTQYLKIDIGKAVNDYGNAWPTIIAEIGVIDQNKQVVPIHSITNLGSGNPDVQNLIDEQSSIEYPATYMTQTYFDEIYFVRTAEQYINHQSPFEWTHPPLGKLIQAAGIMIFGFSPFGWRIMGVIFGMFMIALIYLLGKKLFGTWIGGFSAGFLLTFDFMHFTMARMGTADTYVVFFAIASQLFFLIYLKNVLKEGWKTSVIPLFLTIIFFTLSFATKWVALYCLIAELAILAVLRLKQVLSLKASVYTKFYEFAEHPFTRIVIFLVVAVFVYFLIYIPDLIAGRPIADVINLQFSMYSYHATLNATHPFSSPWFTWPLLFDPFKSAIHVPLWLDSTTAAGGLTSTIVVLGNPAVWWVGFAAVLIIAAIFLNQVLTSAVKYLLSVIKHVKATIQFTVDLPAFFILAFFFIQWVPYIFITRVIFIYHFYLDVPFLILASTYFINKFWPHKWGKLLTILYFALVVAAFVLFYPVISGVPTSSSTINSLKWFNSWVF